MTQVILLSLPVALSLPQKRVQRRQVLRKDGFLLVKTVIE
jgi:hypothetical protein